MRKTIKLYSFILLMVFSLLFSGCAVHVDVPSPAGEDTETTAKTEEVTEPSVPSPEVTEEAEEKDETTETTEEGKDVNVTITMQDGGVMQLELYADKAPKTVANFVKLAKEGFYDGLTFHRIIEDFMIQGGDPEGTGMGGSDENIPGEFAANGFAQNDISHVRGVISMARAQSPDSASSQFFIVHADSTYLDGQYAAFGMLTDGFDVLDRLASVEVGPDGQTPLAKPVIKTITVE